jgi:phospholipid/cholesterol/gamma-HCH transport system permease protein
VVLLAWDTLVKALRPPYEWDLLSAELYHLGARSLSITNVTALFTGMVIAVQTAYSLGAYGVKSFTGDMVSLSIVRELGPVLTGLMMAGRVGSGITAEIGSMAVTEQVDAIRALAADPVRKLVVPKVIATLIMVPTLTILADCVGILGGLFIAVFNLQQPAPFYLRHVRNALDLQDVFSGLGKSVFFALFISVIGCYNGLSTRGGASGVGRYTTYTVVAASIMILISDFFLTKIFLVFF